MSDILVIRGGALGDFLLTLPILRALRRSSPGRRVELLCAARWAALAPLLTQVDAPRRLEDPGLARFFVPGAPLDDSWREYFASFTTVVSYLYDPDDYFHDHLRRCGITTIVRGPFKPLENGEHATMQLAQALKKLGLDLHPPDWQPVPWPGDAPSADPLRLAVHPGSGSPRKNWGTDNWRALIRTLHQETGAHFLIVSGEAEEPLIDEFTHWLTADGIPFTSARNLPLIELAAQLATCRLFLGHDTGPAHLAAALGLPCVLVFGPTNPAVWAPLGEHVTVCRHPSFSMASVGVSDLAAAARTALATWQNRIPQACSLS